MKVDNPEVKSGDTVWVWHHGAPQAVAVQVGEVEDGAVWDEASQSFVPKAVRIVTWSGYAAYVWHASREDALEYALVRCSQLARAAERSDFAHSDVVRLVNAVKDVSLYPADDLTAER